MTSPLPPRELVAYAKQARLERAHLTHAFNQQAWDVVDNMFLNAGRHLKGTKTLKIWQPIPYNEPVLSFQKNGYFDHSRSSEIISSMIGALMGLPIAPIGIDEQGIYSYLPTKVEKNGYRKSPHLYLPRTSSHIAIIAAIEQFSSLSPFWKFINDYDRHKQNIIRLRHSGDPDKTQLYSIDHEMAFTHKNSTPLGTFKDNSAYMETETNKNSNLARRDFRNYPAH